MNNEIQNHGGGVGVGENLMVTYNIYLFILTYNI